MKILGIETSCDETGIAIVEKSKSAELRVLSNVVASSLHLHALSGGIIPEEAAREQIKFILPTLKTALLEGLSYIINSETKPDIDAIAVTYGPGLIGSLLVGVETARTLSYLWNIPLLPINHMHGHIYANFIGKTQNSKLKTQKEIQFPAIALVVSGGHTDLLFMKDEKSFEVLGGTRDDAAGEAFDKIGRILGLAYPAGPIISELAKKGDPKAYILPRPMIGSGDFDFSFSGLKTSVLYLVKDNKWDFSRYTNRVILERGESRLRESYKLKDPIASLQDDKEQLLADLCASVQEAIVDVLAKKTIKAARKYNVKSILLGGGVASNEYLKQALMLETKDQRLTTALFVPEKKFCTDNGAMIAAAGFFQDRNVLWKDLSPNPELYY